MNTFIPPQQLLAEIKAKTGLGEKAIGERIGCSQPTVNRILNGHSDCKSSLLIAILQWHGELVAADAETGEAAA
jgi:predicted transcriptional regulator